MQELAHIGSAAAHPFKPWLNEPAQLVVGPGKPGVDIGVALNGTREPEELIHRPSLPARRVMSKVRRAGERSVTRHHQYHR